MFILKSETRAYGKNHQEYNRRIKKSHDIKVFWCMPGSIEYGEGNKMKIVLENVKQWDDSGTPIMVLEPELVVLAAELSLSAGTEKLAEIMGVERSEDAGFFSPVEGILNPTPSIRPGIYVAGAAFAQKDINDCINQAEAASMRAYLDTL